MRKFTNTYLEIDLPKGWTANPEEECVTIVKSDDGGALQISSFQKQDGVVSRQDLIEATDCDEETQRQLQEKTWGDFVGFQLRYSEDDVFWRKWWLSKGQTLLFVTYNCDLARKDDEKEEVNQMVGSLKANRRTSG